MPDKKLTLSQKPTQPPTGADFSALVTKVNELASKVGVAKLNSTITGKIPAWKRWVGGEVEYDGVGMRDVVNANALMLDTVKAHLDLLDERESDHNKAQAARISALEEAASNFVPFGGSG